MSKVEPLHNMVLVRHELKTQTAGGIVLPQTVKQVNRSTVVAVGPECKYVRAGNDVHIIGRAVTYELECLPGHALVYEQDVLAVEVPS